MQVFVDSADLDEIARWTGEGVIDGVTTNPSIMLQDGARDPATRAREIATLVEGRPVSVEVTTDEPAEMLTQAATLADLAPNIVVKIPIINASGVPCLHVIRALTSAGIKVNCTAILTVNQMMLAAKAGATYLSIFAGRISDEGQSATPVIEDSARWVERWGLGKILVGSIRGVIDVQMAALAGAHIVTIPPRFLAKMADHQYSRDTVRGFMEDAEKALSEIGRRGRSRGKGRAA